MVREVTDEDVGLKVLYDGMANDPPANGGKMFDIVAVHGMGAHPDDTWCKAVGPNDDRHYVNWLQERNMLPAAVPNARIMRYGYHSNWFGKDSISTRAYNISQRLLLTLTNKRNDNPTRPLIFIAHSFGGLVVLKVLLDAFLENKRWSSIYEYTIGLIFLGTPFRGTHDSMSQGEILQVAAKCFTDGTVHETNLKILRAGDETLVDLVDSYLRAARQKVMPKVACFFEQRVSPVGAIVGKSDEIKDVILVDESSGCLDINTSSDKYGLPRTHFTINKFGTPNEEDFVTLCSILQNMVKGGPALIKKRQSPAKPRTYHLVPHVPVFHFCGRKDLLNELYDLLRPHKGRDVPPVVVMQALGGQGKTQIALEYCRKNKGCYRGIFWVDATSEASAERSFETIATEINKPVTRTFDDMPSTIRFVLETIESWEEQWLVVYDNYDRPDLYDLRKYIPRTGHGAIIVTSRAEGTGILGELIRVPSMLHDGGVELLLRRMSADEVKKNTPVGLQIVTRLGGLALAIDQAAAYIASRRTDLTTFLLEYEVQKAKILQYTREDFWDYNKQIAESEQSRALSAFTTWELSFQQIESQDAERKSRVGHFLTVSAFLEPSHIGEYLFRIYRKEAEVTPPWTDIFTSGYDSDEDESSNEEESSEKWRKEKFWEVIERLHRLSLLQSIETMPAASFSLHPLIRDWLQLRRKKSERQKFLREAIRLMSTLLRDSWSEESPLATRQKLLAHLDACTANCRHFKFIRGLGSGDMMDETQLFGDFYESEGRYMEAHNLFKSLLEDNKSFLEEDHPLRVSSMSNLARICRHLGRFKESENLDIQVLEVQKRVLGAEHPDTLTSMASLAATYCRQGRYKKSEGLKIQVLEVQKRALGVEHPDTVITMGNLALTYTELGWWKKAEELEVQALEVQKRVLGEERIDTLVSMSNLASIYWQQGRYKESEALEVQVVEVEKRVLGAEHPDTLLSMGNLAITYTEQGLFKESEELNLQVLEVQKRLLGVEHPDTVITMGNLASTYWQQGCYKESEELEVQVLEVRKRVLGEEHPDTLLSMGNLASIYWEQGCYKEFEALEGQVLEVRKRVLGEGHPQTLISVAKLASTGWDQGRQQEALDTMRSNAESQKKRLGADHPSTLPASKKRRM